MIFNKAPIVSFECADVFLGMNRCQEVVRILKGKSN